MLSQSLAWRAFGHQSSDAGTTTRKSAQYYSGQASVSSAAHLKLSTEFDQYNRWQIRLLLTLKHATDYRAATWALESGKVLVQPRGSKDT